MSNKLLTTKQLAEELQVTEVTLWRWRKDGMPVEKIGAKTYRYDLESVRRWAAKRKELK